LRRQVEAVELDVASGDGDGFDRLIDRLGADRLNFDGLLAA
jgi:hypothetical protein